jgi:adenylate cyclase
VTQSSSSNNSSEQTDHDTPYPLKRLFRNRVLPMFLLLAAAFCIGAGWGGTHLMQSVYMEFAARRATIIDRAMSEGAPGPWTALAKGALPENVFVTPEGLLLLDALGDEEAELSLSHLKVYGRDGIIVYSSEPHLIGTRDASPGFLAAMHDDTRSLIKKRAADGTDLYELYAPVSSTNGGRLVFELYEPIGVLDTLLIKIAAPAVAVPLIFLVLLGFVTNGLVLRAQGDIDWRTGQLARLRKELERFVSRSTIDATRQSLESASMVSSKMDCTLLMSDIRDFTAYSEETPPEQVVAFLNQVMSVQVAAISRFGGDVDKMIGDAVLARFDGPDRERRAIDAAELLLGDLADKDFPRGVGVGVFSGPVISGAIGPVDRQDFTVIGDSVNVAARLCSVARAGELVVDVQTVRAAGTEPATSEELSLKGRRQALRVERRKLA